MLIRMPGGESRFPNELKALWECSNLTDNSYLQIKWEENRLLVGLDQQFDASDWQKYLRLRGVRRGRFAQSYFYDSAVEVIEGSAQYVEWEALYQLNAGKAVSAKEQAAQRMQTVTSLLPARPLCYDSGAMLLSICCNNHLPVNRAVGKCSEYLLSEATLDAAAVHPDVQIGYAAAVEQFSRENRMMLEERLRSAKANPPIAEMSEGLELLGVNVYSAQNFNGYLYTEQFVMYRGTDGVPVVKQGDFFLEMLDETRIRRIYRA